MLAYLAAHAEIYRQEFHDNAWSMLRCYLPRHLLHHIQGPDVSVRLLEPETAQSSRQKAVGSRQKAGGRKQAAESRRGELFWMGEHTA